MASLARVEDEAASLRGSGRARCFRADAKGLAAFRTLADVEYDL